MLTTSEQTPDILKKYTWYIPGIYQDKIDMPGIYQIYTRFVLCRSRYGLSCDLPGIYQEYDRINRNVTIYPVIYLVYTRNMTGKTVT